MENSESLEMELLCSRSGQLNGPSGDDVEDGAYKERYKQAVRELEFTRRRLQQQHQDDLEQLVGLKKQLEKKVNDLSILLYASKMFRKFLRLKSGYITWVENFLLKIHLLIC